MNKIVLITGATSGIGEATAIKFAQNNYNLILTGRRDQRLKKLKLYLEDSNNVKVLILNFDISNKEEVAKSISSLTAEWKNIDVLVNNAGLAIGLNPIHEGLFHDWDQMIDTNIKGLLYITKLVAQLMLNKTIPNSAIQRGQIINIGSVAGKDVYPSGNVYCATKFAVDALSKAMRIDLMKLNIKVTQILPGAVNTEFSTVRFKGDKLKADKVYTGYLPLKAEDVAETIYYVTTLAANVNISELIITCLAQANATMFNKQL